MLVRIRTSHLQIVELTIRGITASRLDSISAFLREKCQVQSNPGGRRYTGTDKSDLFGGYGMLTSVVCPGITGALPLQD